MAALDNFLVVSIIIFIVLIIWSRIMNQRVLDTVLEIKEIVLGLKK